MFSVTYKCLYKYAGKFDCIQNVFMYSQIQIKQLGTYYNYIYILIFKTIILYIQILNLYVNIINTIIKFKNRFRRE